MTELRVDKLIIPSVDFNGESTLPSISENLSSLGTRYGRMKLRIYYGQNYEEIYYVDSDDVKDLALLRLDSPTTLRKPLKFAEESAQGQTVFVVGYPGLADYV